MLLPIVLSLLFAVLAVRKQNLSYSILSGIFGALACWIKPPAITSILFVFIYFTLAFLSVDKKKPVFQNIFKPLLYWVAGGLGISTLICAYFYSKGVFTEFIYWSFKHSFLYSAQVNIFDNLYVVYFRLKEILAGDGLAIGLGIIVALIALFRKRKSSCFILGFFVFSMLGTIPGYTYRQDDRLF